VDFYEISLFPLFLFNLKVHVWVSVPESQSYRLGRSVSLLLPDALLYLSHFFHPCPSSPQSSWAVLDYYHLSALHIRHTQKSSLENAVEYMAVGTWDLGWIRQPLDCQYFLTRWYISLQDVI